MKKTLLFSFVFMFCCINLSFAGGSEEKNIASGQIADRCSKYMTAIKYQDWDEAYHYISSRTNKNKFIARMEQFLWNEDKNPFAPKFLSFYIDKINFNQFVDAAEVCVTEKLNLWKSKESKGEWSESEFPGKIYWKKESDGQWYLDYGIGVVAIPVK